MKTAALLLLLALLAGCTTRPASSPKLPYHVPAAPELGEVPPAKSSPVRIVFIREEARR